MKDLTVSNVTVRFIDGLYSLNDLHKAAGGEDKHQPSLFMRLDSTKALVEEIVNENKRSTEMQTAVRVINGNGGGTYVCKELVYAYAMWISPTFNLRVIRAFDQMVTNPDTSKAPSVTGILSAPAADFQALYSMLRAMELDRNAAAIGANGAIIRTSGINLLKLTGQTRLLSETQSNWYIPTELGEMLEPTVKPAKVNIRLAVAGLQVKNHVTGKWELTEEGQKYGRVTEVTPTHGGKMRPQIVWKKDVLPLVEQPVEGE